LRRVGIDEATVAQHFHLVSPLHAKPLDPASRVLLFAGEWDSVVEARDVAELHSTWPNSEYATVPQGHFGYRMMREAWTTVEQHGLLEGRRPEASPLSSSEKR
jgi:hypothetical protein